ncbi:MAG: hypothetical protein J5632_02010, partial [Bacteroidales bacterium]|nr:hypothetical protein [Bacteroidales bacterium]
SKVCVDIVNTIPSLKHFHILKAIFKRMFFTHNKTPKVFCLTFGVHVTAPVIFISPVATGELHQFFHLILVGEQFF